MSLKIPIWEDGRWSDLPVLDGEVRADVCVVGLGGSGLSCLAELVSRGVSVVGLDAGQVGGGAAGRNGGFLLAGMCDFHDVAIRRHGHARAVAIYRATVDEIDRILGETPSVVRRTGSLRIASSPEEMDACRAQHRVMLRDHLPAELYTGSEGEGLLIPTDACFDPLGRCRILADRLSSAGARLHERSPALEIRRDRVTTPRGRVRCRAVVVAVDGKLELVLPELEGRVRTARLQMLGTAPAPEVSFPRATYFRWGLDYWQQLADGRIALGGCRDLGGETEWTPHANPTEPVQNLLETLLRERLGVRAPITHRWAASAAFTPDGLPILEEVRPGVWGVGGYSGTGNVIGSIWGRAAARLAIGLAPEIP